MSPPDLWSRIRSARLFRVLVVYLGASWVLLQVTSMLRDALQLPRWVSPVAVILLMIGLAIILATAWVQSHPAASAPGTAAEASAAPRPGKWEVDLQEMAGTLAKGRMPHLTWGRALAGGTAAFLLLFGFAGLYVVIQDRGRSLTPSPAVAGEAAPGLAVLPFAVQGKDLADWREGMISLLSTDLDGVGGLRAIDGRTVLARWREKVPEGQPADLQTSLAVARATGARDAVVGSATSIGPVVRVSADIYDVTSGAKLGSARVEGPPDSVLSLVDRLAVQVLTALPRKGDEAIPQVDLARATTSSVPALKAFLEGEAAYRRSDFAAAAAAYRRAVDADSTFAFAWYRLSFSYGWVQSIMSSDEQEAAQRSVRLADRLPERERLLVEANHDLDHGSAAGLALMQDAARRYPEDPEVWYLLGEQQQHIGYQALLPSYGFDAADASFGRAVALDSSFSPAYIHLIDNAFGRHDSAAAARLVAAYARLAPGSVWDRANRLSLALVFGDSANRKGALAALDTVSAQILRFGFNPYRLTNPAASAVERAAFERIRGRPDLPTLTALSHYLSLWQAGQLDDALDAQDLPRFQSFSGELNYEYFTSHDLPEPAERRAWSTEPRPEEAGPVTDFFRGAAAADQGRGSDVAEDVGRLRRSARASLAGGDSVSAQFFEGAARGLAGYAAWKRGDRAAALDSLQSAQREATGYAGRGGTNEVLCWWTGNLLVELKRPREAVPYFSALWDPVYGGDPFAALELGRIYAETGEKGKARTAYRWVLDVWKDADPSLKPRVEEAKRALAALGS